MNLRTGMFFICIFSLSGLLSAQTVVNSSGQTLKSADYIFEYSIGEPAITTISASGNYATQGLLQPSLKIINPDCVIINDTVQYFPTPVRSVMSVVSRGDWIQGYHIYAADGKLVKVSNFVNNQIDFSMYPAGVYFIKLFPGCNDKFHVLKVLKQ